MAPANATQNTQDKQPHTSSASIPLFSSLRARLIFIMVLAFIPAALFLVLDALSIREQVFDDAQADLARLDRLIAGAYSQQLDEANRLLAAIAQFSEVQTGTAAACSARLAQFVDLYKPKYQGFAVVDRDGALLCSGAPLTTTVTFADRLWFREAMRTGKFAIGEFAIGRPTGTPNLGLGYPVLDQAGQVTRVVVHGMALRDLQAQGNALPLPADAVLTITDRNGVILVRAPDGEKWIGKRQAPALLADMERLGEGVGEAPGVDGVNRIYAFTPIRGPGGAQVWLSIGRTPEAIAGVVWQSILRNILGIGAILLVALAAVWIGSNRLLLRRIDQLVNASVQLAQGNDRARAPVHQQRDELDHLALTFNAMAETLVQRQAEQERVRAALEEREEALQTARITLEERVRERTAELERSNRELNQFAYVASHDLKAPLRAIEHLASWIAEDAGPVLPPGSAEHLAVLRGRVKRMEKLLDDLLAYSRAGRVQYAVEKVDLDALVQDVVSVLAPPADFVVTVEPPGFEFYTQRIALEMVLRNLIGNAIKHHHRQDGHIHVCVTDHGRFVELSVGDDGPGIETQYHGRIFEMFQTLQPRDEVEGSGMGLAIVKKMVESYGGVISIASTPGQGTTLRATWPSEEQRQAEQAS